MLDFDKYLQFRLRHDTDLKLYNGKREYERNHEKSTFTDKEIESIEYLCLTLPEEPYKLSIGDSGQMIMWYKNLPLNDTLYKSRISIFKHDDGGYSIRWAISETGKPYVYPDKDKDKKLISIFDVFNHINKRWKTINFSKIIK